MERFRVEPIDQRAPVRANGSFLLPRLHVFEFTDQAWLPNTVRAIVTDAIGEAFKGCGVASEIGKTLASMIRESGGEPEILELAAGSAEASVLLVNELGATVRYTVSDKYPDLNAFRRSCQITQGRLTFIEEPIDVLNIPGDLQGLRLLVMSFHHFRPEQALRILQGAYDRRLPIAIFEFTDRRLVRTLLIGPLCVLQMLTLLPKILKEYSWRGAVGFLPATVAYAWDGFVSCLRSYTLREFGSMTRPLSDGYRWRMGNSRTAIPGVRLTYLLGAA